MGPLTNSGIGKLLAAPLTPLKFMACICVVLRSPPVMSCFAVRNGEWGLNLGLVMPKITVLLLNIEIETPSPPPIRIPQAIEYTKKKAVNLVY